MSKNRNRNRNKRDRNNESKQTVVEKSGHVLSDYEYSEYERFLRLQDQFFEKAETVKEQWEELVQSIHDSSGIDIVSEENGKETQNAILGLFKLIDLYRYKSNQKKKKKSLVHWENPKSNNNKHIYVVPKNKKKPVYDVKFINSDLKIVSEDFTYSTSNDPLGDVIKSKKGLSDEMIDNILNFKFDRDQLLDNNKDNKAPNENNCDPCQPY
jgi:hypothetical protein